MNIALVLSGGTGTRLGGDIPKQYIKVKGRMLIAYCLNMFAAHSAIDGIFVVAAPEWRDEIINECGRLGIGEAAITGFSDPGRTRQLSILNGLRDIDTYVKSLDKNDDPVVIIHDAARPNLTAEYLDRCLDAIEGCDGVMPTLPMKDTVYYSENGTKVDKLLDRSCIFAGQAPELYRLKKYLEANEKLLPDDILKINGSTEPAVMAGLNVVMIPGDENNYKVTTKKDMDRFIQDLVLKSQFAAWEQ